jgi:hypothetical protein
MIEFAAAWDAANPKSENEPSSNNDNGDQQASGSPDQDGDNQGNGKNRNRRKRGRGRGRNRHENGAENNANDTGDNNSGDNGNNGGEKQIAASNETADNQQPQANGVAAQPEPQAEPVKADADEKPALSKREEIAVEVAREEAPENSDEAPKRVRATEANINHDVEPVVVSKTGDKPKPKKGGWWARKLLG